MLKRHSIHLERLDSSDGADRAIARVVAEIRDGLRHGYFEYVVTCEITGQERRRLILKAGKSYQFLIPKEECLGQASSAVDFREGSDLNRL